MVELNNIQSLLGASESANSFISQGSILIYAFSAFSLFLIAELIHQLRIRQVQKLAFGPAQKQRLWTYANILFKPAAVGLLVLGFCLLINTEPEARSATNKKIPERDYHRLVFMVDSSPSMEAEDAIYRDEKTNEIQKICRREKIREVVHDLLFNSQIPLDRVCIDIVPFWYEARVAVEGFKDHEAAKQMSANFFLLSFEYKNKDKKHETNIFKSLEQTFKRLERLKKTGKLAEKGATVFLFTDGQTLPPKNMPKMPSSVSKVVVVGLGDTKKAFNLRNGIATKQDQRSLKSLASRLRGFYYNANTDSIPSNDANSLVIKNLPAESNQIGSIFWAKVFILSGAGYLALIPIFLHFFGSGWKSIFHKSKSNSKGAK